MTETPPPGDPYATGPNQPPPPPPNPYGDATRQQPAYGGAPPPAPPQQNHPAGPGSPYDGPAAQSTDAAGFFKALFDFSFSTFITPKVVKFVYVLATGLLGLIWLVWLVVAFDNSAGLGLFVLIIGPIIFLLYLALIRMTLEFYLAIVRMSEDIHRRLPPG